MSTCAVSLAEINHDHDNEKNSVNEFFVAVEQMDQVREAAKRILAGHSIPAMRHSSRFDPETEKSIPFLEKINFRMDHVTSLVTERVTNEMLIGLHRGDPLVIAKMQKLVRECAEEVAFDALNFDSAPFLHIEELREAAE